MARLSADLPLPVAAACCDAIGRYAQTQQAGGDDRPIGQVRTDVLTDLILRPLDTTRPAVSAEVTIHLTSPAPPTPAAVPPAPVPASTAAVKPAWMSARPRPTWTVI